MLKNVIKYAGLPLWFVILSFVSCKESTIEPEFFGAIQGTVMDAKTGRPVEGAQVSTSPATNSITTNTEGRYIIEDIPVGEYSVSVKKDGYVKSTVSITVREDVIAKATTLLEKDSRSNYPPDKPFNQVPANEATGQAVIITLAWNATDPDDDDSLKFDIYLYESNQVEKKLIASDYRDTSITVEDLKYNTTYFWQVISKDSSGEETNGDVWSFRTMVVPELPIVYASKNSGNYELYLTDTLNTQTLKITSNSDRDWWPQFNPRGDQIAFASNRDDQTQIYRMKPDGTGLYRITSIPVAGYHNNGRGYCWSSDGSRIIYSNYDKLYSIDLNGGGLKQIATAPAGRHFRECNWSAVGNKIVVLTIGQNIYDSEIYIMDSDGTDMNLLVDNLPGIMENPVFLPDGKSIIYTRDVAGTEVQEGRQLNSHIFLVNISTKAETDLSTAKPDGTNDLYPRISPSGANIVFTNASNTGTGTKSIYTISVTDVTNNRNRTKIVTDAEMADWR